MLARSVRRESYLDAVLTESTRRDVTGLDVLAPRLASAGDGKRTIRAIQDAWTQINKSGRVRVVTLYSDECLKAGAELLIGGIEVRVTRPELGKESLSYHLFKGTVFTGAAPTALVNHHQGGKDPAGPPQRRCLQRGARDPHDARPTGACPGCPRAGERQ
ncbi:MAG TPA: hypothetical protein VLJ59_04270 [Mycobacteriales bacterium]|nr:hypothetical protein [Mycobacteriales bacterium]